MIVKWWGENGGKFVAYWQTKNMFLYLCNFNKVKSEKMIF